MPDTGFDLDPEGEAYWQGRADDIEGDRWASGKAGPSQVESTAGSSSDGDQKTVSMPTGNARTVVGFMGVAMIFSVIGAEIRAANPATSSGVNVGKAFSEPYLIIGGGTIATTFLVLIATAGDTGRRFAIGLSALTMVTAVLVNGGPVWKAINGFIGSEPTTPTDTTKATAPTGATTKTRAA